MHHYRFPFVRMVIASAIFVVCSCAVGGAVVSGHVEAWGYQFFGAATVPPGLDGVIAVAGGNDHSLALRTNGTVVAWGSNHRGETDVPAGLSNVVAIAASSFSAAVRADGTVVVWGYNAAEVTNVPPAAAGIIQVALSQQAVYALRTNGTVIAWGYNEPEKEIPPNLSEVVQIAAGTSHVLALKRNGEIVAWGGNFNGQATPLPGLTNVTVVRGGQETSVALKADGTMVKWGGDFDMHEIPPGVSGVVDFDLGFQHALALRADGTVLAWGTDFAGQNTVPPLLSGVTGIAAGGNHNLVITARPVINSITPPVTTTAGANVTLTVEASGEPLRYQWQNRGMNVPGATNATLSIRSIDPSRAGSYAVYVSNPHGNNYAATTVSLPPPGITAQPESRTVYRGEKATLSVAVSGFAPFTYQWFTNGLAIPNATNATVMAPTLGREDSRVYHVTVTDVTGAAVTSSNAVLTVFDPRPASVTLRPAVDTSIFSAGGNPQETILSGTRRNGVRDRGLLRFDLSAIAPNAVLEAVSLRLQVLKAPLGGGAASTFHLHRALKPWGTEATWANASSTLPWSAAGGAENVDYTAQGIPGKLLTGSGELVFGGTNEFFAEISAWIQNPATNHGWFLISDAEEVPMTARHFGSSETETPPQLLISYSLPAEVPTIRGMARASTNFVFAIDGVAGWFYNLQTREEVDRGDWTTFTNAAAGAGLSPIVITVPMTNAHQFFRAFRY